MISPWKENSPKRSLNLTMVSGTVLGIAGFFLGFAYPLFSTPPSNIWPIASLTSGVIIGVPIGVGIGAALGYLMDRFPPMLKIIWMGVLGMVLIGSLMAIFLGFKSMDKYFTTKSPIIRTQADIEARDPNLKRISSNVVSDKNIGLLSKFQLLEELDLHGNSNITDLGLETLRSIQFPLLRELTLMSCPKITDAGLRSVTSMHSLTFLNLADCSGITDTGLSHLVSAENLMELDLRACNNITDVGIKSLGKLSSLKRLELGGATHITAEGIAELKKTLPHCRIKKDDREWAMHAK